MNSNGKLQGMRLLLSRDRVLGIIIGVALGLLVISVLALLLRVWLVILFVPLSFGLILALPIVVGIMVGLGIVDRWKPPKLSWPMLLTVAVLLWPTALYLPFGVQFLRLGAIAQLEIPMYPLAEHERTSVEWGDGENHGDRVHLFFVTDSSPSDIVQFYRDRLLEKSWEEGPAHFIEWERFGTPYWFKKARTGIVHIKIRPTGPDDRTEFVVVFEP